MRLIFDIPDDMQSYGVTACLMAAIKAFQYWQKEIIWSQDAISRYRDSAFGAEIITSTKRIRNGYSVKVRFGEEDDNDAA